MTSNHQPSNLFSFLDDELGGYGFTPQQTDYPPIDDWTLSRDEFGFVVKSTCDAHIAIRKYLESAFPPARFSDTDAEAGSTLIYREDDCHTTAMLNQHRHETELIVLYWKDRDVRARASAKVDAAINQVFDTAFHEFEEIVDASLAETDEGRQAAKIDAASEKLREIKDAIDWLSRDNDE